MELQIVHLMERLITQVALVPFDPAMGQAMAIVVAFLMKTLSAEVAREWLVP